MTNSRLNEHKHFRSYCLGGKAIGHLLKQGTGQKRSDTIGLEQIVNIILSGS